MSFGGVLKRFASWLQPARIIVQGRERAGTQLALTFDDGPHPEQTPRILDVLEERQVTATFFIQGTQARLHPEIVRRIHASGHQIASHGFEHLSAKRIPAEAALANALKCHELLQEIAGCALRRDFRPPYGDLTLQSYRAWTTNGFRLVFWSFDSHDSFLPDAQQLTQRVTGAQLGAGSIALFHDDYATTAAALPAILKSWQDRRVTFARVGEF
jgi:peptidoglycan/xylan/chitin deacetylase (PgdA/CDA1 family)